jgi:hypothetical protein
MSFLKKAKKKAKEAAKKTTKTAEKVGKEGVKLGKKGFKETRKLPRKQRKNEIVIFNSASPPLFPFSISDWVNGTSWLLRERRCGYIPQMQIKKQYSPVRTAYSGDVSRRHFNRAIALREILRLSKQFFAFLS